MDWLKVEHGLPDKPEVSAIAARLNLDIDAVVTKCLRVWIWFETHTTDGHAPGATAAFIDRYAHAAGLSEAMAAAGWLTITDGAVTVPKFGKHLGREAKKRAQSNARVDAHRQKKNGENGVTRVKRKCNAQSVTQAATTLFPNDLENDTKHASERGGGRGGSAHSVRNARIRGEEKTSAKAVAIADLVFPLALDTNEARAAIGEWLDYKRTKGQSYKKASFVQKLLDSFSGRGTAALVAAVNRSIGNNWDGLFPDKEVRGGQARDHAGSTYDPNATG